ncbi:MAG: (2Fe-2S) ferredoxin domain-containing protein [Christensenellaceae bacterium]|nr:(2Fe-2S) ferredoxin domain-containing protein [Christensenellaceae bacterium]
MRKSLEQLEAIRQKTLNNINLRKDDDSRARIVIGMATCGIAAGARPVMMEFMKELERRNISNVSVTQTGCIGMCRLEPMLDVIIPGKEKVTYVHVKPEMVGRIVAEHIVNGSPVTEYTIGKAMENDK